MNPYIVFTILALMIVILNIYKEINKNKLSLAQLQSLDFIIKKGIEYAEQMYKTNIDVDRKQLAINFVNESLDNAGIHLNSSKLLYIIGGLIEANVLNLPQTHTAK